MSEIGWYLGNFKSFKNSVCELCVREQISWYEGLWNKSQSKV